MLSFGDIVSAEELKKIINLLPGYVCLKDTSGAIVYCNQGVAKTLNMSSVQDVVGLRDRDFFSVEQSAIIEQNDQKVMQQNIKCDFIEHVRDKNGNNHAYYSKKTPYHNQQGEVIGLLCISIDIQELDDKIHHLEAEKDDMAEYITKMRYLEKIAPWFPGYLYWKGLDGVYLGCNENQRKIFEHMTPTLVGKTVFELLPDDVAQRIHEADEQIMLSGEGAVIQETMVDKRGREYITMSSKMPVMNESGKVTGMLGVSIDITERIRMEESLKRAKLAADAANNAKSDFIMNMSHDLRTPFVSIIGFANALLQTEQAQTNQTMLQHINNSANQLLKIIDELIELASMDDEVVTANSRINIRTLVDGMVALVQPNMDLNQLDLNICIDEDVPRYVVGNKFALNRIILNLLGNSVKFTDQGFVAIKISVLKSEGDNNIVMRFVVEDSGIGIPLAQMKKIFKKFYRATSVKGRFEGTGLGLYFVKLLVDQMMGSIKIDADYDQGARFICDLPFQLKA